MRPDLCTTGDILHGGALMAFADTLGGVATFVNLPPNTRTTTIESSTKFLRGAPVGSTVRAECTAFHKGRTTMVWQTLVARPDDRCAPWSPRRSSSSRPEAARRDLIGRWTASPSSRRSAARRGAAHRARWSSARLVACAQISAIESFYLWDGALQDDEFRLLLKTVEARYDAVEAAIRESHPYELPAIYAERLEPVYVAYAEWIERMTRDATPTQPRTAS